MKVLRILLLAPLIVSLLATCQRSEKRCLVGVSQCSNDIWRDKLNTELRIGSYYYNNLDITIASANDNDDEQIQQIVLIISKTKMLIVLDIQKEKITCISSRC